MTCLEAMHEIQPFVEGRLTDRQLEPFMQHILTCPECREELGIYYTVLKGVDQLDEKPEGDELDIEASFHHELYTVTRRIVLHSALETARYCTMTLAYLGTAATFVLMLFVFKIL